MAESARRQDQAMLQDAQLYQQANAALLTLIHQDTPTADQYAAQLRNEAMGPANNALGMANFDDNLGALMGGGGIMDSSLFGSS
jgi:hypothetical protein